MDESTQAKGGSKRTQQRAGTERPRRGSEGKSAQGTGRGRPDRQGRRQEQASPKAGSGQGSRKN